MSKRTRRRMLAAATVPVAALIASACAPLNVKGPSTSTAPYVRGVADDVTVRSLLTVGDDRAADNGYEMVGIPDGLGARLDENGDIVLAMNHELQPAAGLTRLHGERGAFVSRLVIDPSNQRVLEGADLIQPGVEYWNYLDGAYDEAGSPAGTRDDGKTFPAYGSAFARFCSSSLTDPGQLFNGLTGRGYLGQIYLTGEEAGDEGRAFGVIETGEARQLPRLGLFSWENALVAATSSDTTLVMGNEDTAAGQLWAYVGRKVSVGAPWNRAGLQNGRNTVVSLDVDGLPETDDANTDAEFRAAHAVGDAVPFTIKTVNWNQSGADQNAEAATKGLTLNRIEDGAFDPANPNDFYFVTTEGGEGTQSGGGGGLWRLRYTNVNQPAQGGTLTLLLDGTEDIGLVKPDNMDIDADGNLLVQEDPGAIDALARIVAYRISDGATGVVAQFDPERFSPGGAAFLTNDEESSGIIDASELLGEGSWLFTVQVHTAEGLPPGNGEGTVEEYVEHGQIAQLTVSNWDSVYPDPV